jgi:type IV secretory pathway VirB10-like protein
VKAVPPPAPPPVPAEEAAVPKPTPEKTKAEPHEPSPGEILRGQVKPLWESGKYDQALRLVNGILADTPDQAEALAWKKKIRAAQQAEAAIK